MFEEKLGGDIYRRAIEIYKKVASALFGQFQDWSHYSQVLRSAGSIAANIAEGTGRLGKSDGYYRQFLQIARGSAFETLAWIQLGVIDKIIEPDVEKDIGSDIVALSDLLFKQVMKSIEK